MQQPGVGDGIAARGKRELKNEEGEKNDDSCDGGEAALGVLHVRRTIAEDPNEWEG